MSVLAAFLLMIATVAHAGANKCDPANPPGPYDIANPNLGLEEEPGDAGCKQGMVRIGQTADDAGFCIDRFGAALMEVWADGVETPWSPFHNPGERSVRAVVLTHAVPQGYISGIQSEQACKVAGKRLCTDDEYLRTCRGVKNTVYPYADVRYPTGTSPQHPACNEARDKHPVLELFPDDPHPFSHLGNACINQLDHTVARGGAFSKCVSAERVYDLMGNLHEWMANPDPVTGKGRFRGGYYMDTRRNGEGCLYLTHAHKFKYWDYSTGFRCCFTPQAN